MTESIDEWTNQVHQGDAAETLQELPESSVHAVVTSPPYYLLRDYGEGAVRAWDADPECEHEWVDRERYEDSPMREQGGAGTRGEGTTEPDERVIEDAVCTKCDAWRGQLGLEPTVDLYIDHLMAVFEEVRRVLRPDGVLWINIDDKYATNDRGNPGDHSSSGLHGGEISDEYADTLTESVGTARGGVRAIRPPEVDVRGARAVGDTHD